MIQGFLTHFGGLDEDGQVPFCLLLSNILTERLGTQGIFPLIFPQQRSRDQGLLRLKTTVTGKVDAHSVRPFPYLSPAPALFDHPFEGLTNDFLQLLGLHIDSLQGDGNFSLTVAQHSQGGGGLSRFIFRNDRDPGFPVLFAAR